MNDQTGKRFVKRRRHPKRRLLCHTIRQRDFALEYLKDLNGTQAAIRAGYSKASASTQAGLLLKTPWVARQIERELERRANKVRIEAEAVLRELADHASADLWDYLEIHDDGTAKVNFAALNRDSAKGLAEYSITKDGVRIKLTDRLEALKLLGQHLRLFVDRVEHDLGDRDLYVELAAWMGLKSASNRELEQAAAALEKGDEKPLPQ